MTTPQSHLRRARTRRSWTRSPPTRGSSRCRSAATTSASPRSSPNCQTANPFGRPCQDKYVRGRGRRAAQSDRRDGAEGRGRARRHQGHDRRADLVLNYEAILPASGSGCWPQVPLAWADVPYVRGIQLELNTMIAKQAAGRGRQARRRLHGEPRQGRVQGIGHALGRAAGAGQRRGAVPPQCPWHGGSDAGGRRRGCGYRWSLAAAARTLLRANLAPSASQRTHFWPSAVHTSRSASACRRTCPCCGSARCRRRAWSRRRSCRGRRTSCASRCGRRRPPRSPRTRPAGPTGSCRHWRSSSCGPVHSHESVLTACRRRRGSSMSTFTSGNVGDRGDAAGTTGLGVRGAAGGEECG